MLSHRDSFIQHKCYCTSGWAVDGWAVGQLVTGWILEVNEKRVVVCILPEDQLVTRGVSRGVLPWGLSLSVTWQKGSIHLNKSADYISLLEAANRLEGRAANTFGRLMGRCFMVGGQETTDKQNKKGSDLIWEKPLTMKRVKLWTGLHRGSSVSILQGFHRIRSDHWSLRNPVWIKSECCSKHAAGLATPEVSFTWSISGILQINSARQKQHFSSRSWRLQDIVASSMCICFKQVLSHSPPVPMSLNKGQLWPRCCTGNKFHDTHITNQLHLGWVGRNSWRFELYLAVSWELCVCILSGQELPVCSFCTDPEIDFLPLG